MSTSRAQAIEAHGFTPVPASLSALISTSPTPPSTPAPPFPLTSLPFPSSPLIHSVLSYARATLPQPTLHHSLRVYHFGVAILAHAFPDWTTISEDSTFLETYALAALLHDIGTTDENLEGTLMSFEFYGGFIADGVLKETGVKKEMREAVVESVVRHQDLGEVGKQTRVGGLLQLATIFDNMGGNAQLVSKETIENVVKEYPRLKWSTCFAHTIQRENGLKPWAHTTHLGERDFPDGVMENKLMAEYE
ncbi:hypothetical protein CJF32_00002364 [Rutstroemia sp. NJR-2017a WRK4]|nr:hypothetical protein CJF32_00002195 [Rutstroemia sp. NJR-2017a WRK4]PQE14822.1 hypothetical protein CJF32_00002364 [Rutstroemia sp. NJR-2017a WRK4]